MKVKKKYKNNKFIWWYEPKNIPKAIKELPKIPKLIPLKKEQKEILKKGEETLKREKVKKQVDKQIYKHTANKTKKINVDPKPMRGGIRL